MFDRTAEREVVFNTERLIERIEFACACLAVFLTPMNYFKLDAVYVTAGDVFAAISVVLLMLQRSLKLRVMGPGTAYWLIGLVLMVGGLLASSLINGSTYRGLILAVEYLFTFLILPLVIIGRTWPQTRALLCVFAASITVMILHGIYVVNILGEVNSTFVSGNGRLLGLLGRDNEFSALIAMSFPMLLTMTSLRILPVYLSVALMLLYAYGIMLTGSNTGLYGMLMGLGFYVLASQRLWQIVALAAGGAVTLALLSNPTVQQALPDVFRNRVLAALETGNIAEAGTFMDRLALMREALRLGSENLFLGMGADQYRVISTFGAPVHNFYLLVWNEGGLVALLGFLLMLVGAFLPAALVWRKPDGRAVAVGCISTLILLAGVVNALPHIFARFWVLPLLLSVAAVVGLRRDRYGKPPAG